MGSFFLQLQHDGVFPLLVRMVPRHAPELQQLRQLQSQLIHLVSARGILEDSLWHCFLNCCSTSGFCCFLIDVGLDRDERFTSFLTGLL